MHDLSLKHIKLWRFPESLKDYWIDWLARSVVQYPWVPHGILGFEPTLHLRFQKAADKALSIIRNVRPV